MSNAYLGRISALPELIKGFDSENHAENPEAYLDLMERHRSGAVLDGSGFPKRMWVNDLEDEDPELPCIFLCGGFWCVTEKLTELLRNFDLGTSALFDVELLKKDRKTRYGGNYFFLNISELRSGFVKERSKDFSSADFGRGRKWWISKSAGDGDIVLDETVLRGSDLWADPNLMFDIGMSARLGELVIEQGFAEDMMLVRCSVI